MKRVLLDTSIYGKLVFDRERNRIAETLRLSVNTVIYGSPLIRKELRDTPKHIRVERVNLRNDLLRVYDEVTKGRTLVISQQAEELAENYFTVYKELGGNLSKYELRNDFVIVACASYKDLDIVVSADKRTMLSEQALKAYNIANKIKKVRMPRFLDYESFKRELTR